MPGTQKKYINKRVGRNVFDAPPKISVVIPAYNSSEYIAETLESVIGQKFREHEIIVVNDGSPDTDKLERAIKMYLEDIIYIRQRNAGAGVARNTGIENARGDIIAFLDSDDVWMPDLLASQYVFLNRHDLDMVYCDATLFGMRSVYRKTMMETAPSEGECNFDSILGLTCNVLTSGTMARKEAIVKAGMFENERVKAEDFHLWLRMAKTGAKIGYQKKPLLKYRVHLESLSGDAIARVERSIDVFQRVERTIDLTAAQRAYVKMQIASFEADLAVEKGKALLLSGEYREAASEFKAANQFRRSPKLAAIGLMTRFAPKTLLRFYRTNRPSEIAFVPRQS
jgi:cellulose synthase/poly-beta-1,6-N-acetylglucosamine synthase-like glycosyltransferase